MKKPELWQKLPRQWPELTHGQRLVAKRKAAGLLQRDIAASSGLSMDRIHNLEHDRGKLTPAEVVDVLRAYNLSPGQWLLGVVSPGRADAVTGTPLESWHRLDQLQPAERRAVERFIFALTEGRDLAAQT